LTHEPFQFVSFTAAQAAQKNTQKKTLALLMFTAAQAAQKTIELQII
jgi:hypothetical protein